MKTEKYYLLVLDDGREATVQISDADYVTNLQTIQETAEKAIGDGDNTKCKQMFISAISKLLNIAESDLEFTQIAMLASWLHNCSPGIDPDPRYFLVMKSRDNQLVISAAKGRQEIRKYLNDYYAGGDVGGVEPKLS